MRTLLGLGCVMLAACGGAIDPEPGGGPNESAPTASLAAAPLAPPEAPVADRCRPTRESQEACFPGLPRYVRGVTTSVFYGDCPDDGYAFVEAARDAGLDCFRPSVFEPTARVWCCQ